MAFCTKNKWIKTVVIFDKLTNKSIRADYGPFRISKLVLATTLPQVYIQLLITLYSRGSQIAMYPKFYVAQGQEEYSRW